MSNKDFSNFNEWEVADGFDLFNNYTDEEILELMSNIFTPSADYSLNAYLSNIHPSHDDEDKHFFMGRVYLTAATKLLDSCIENRFVCKESDTLIFPILFNVVHGVESYLKGLLYLLKTLIIEEDSICKSHNIQKLCDKLMTIAKNNNGDDLYSSLRLVKRFIDTIFEKTSSMDFARYATTTKGENQFYCQYENDDENIKIVEVNMATLKKWIGIIQCNFDGAVEYYTEQRNDNLQ